MTLHQANRDMIIRVARSPGPLRERVTFVGGSVIGLLITDEAVPDVRPTMLVLAAPSVQRMAGYETAILRVKPEDMPKSLSSFCQERDGKRRH